MDVGPLYQYSAKPSQLQGLLERPLRIDGWMTSDFTSFSTVFQSWGGRDAVNEAG